MPSAEPAFPSRAHYRLGQFDVIYPTGQDTLGIDVARYAKLFSSVSWLSSPSCRRFPIILRTHSSVANGMVVWTPSRMELFTLSGGEDETPVPWIKHLVAHEVRHYAQMNALRQGTLWFASFLMGEQAVAIGSALVPVWFLEGDAIYNESRLCGFGRANSGLSYQCYRADLLSGNRLSYDEYLNRSLRYFTPNHYSFGSLMVESTIHDYGTELWPYVLRYTAKYPFTLFPSHWALKRRTGRRRSALFDRVMQHADSLYRANFDARIDPLPEERGDWKMQRFPHVFDGGRRLAYLEQGWHGGPRLMDCELGLDGERYEPRIVYSLRTLNGRIRYADSLAVMAQFEPSPVWRDVVGSDVWVLNLKNGEVDRISQGLHAFSPALNLRDSCVEAIELSTEGKHYLIRLDLHTGEIVDTARLSQSLEMRELLPLPERGQTVVRVASDEGMSLLRYDWRSGGLDTIYGPALTDISQISHYGDALIATASYSYARRAFSIPLDGAKSDSLRIVLIPSYGVEEGEYSPDAGYYYTDYKVNGYRISHAKKLEVGEMVNPSGGSRLYPLLPGQDELPEPRLEQDTVGSQSEYSRLAHALRFHSWLPCFSLQVPSFTDEWDSLLGLSIFSQNDLGTLGLAAGYFWDDGYGGALSLQYKGMIPHLLVSALYHRTDTYARMAKRSFFRHNYLNAGVKAYVPLSFPVSGGTWTVQPYAFLSGDSQPYVLALRSTISGKDWTYHHISDGQLKLGVGLRVGWAMHTGPRDLAPRFGFGVGLSQQSTLLPRSTFGDAYRLKGHVNFPGLWRSHAFTLSGQLYRQMRVKVLKAHTFTNSDYAYQKPENAGIGIETWSARATYTLPWGYPDWNWGAFIYFKRVYSSFWFNWQEVLDTRFRWQQVRTVGASLLFDVHLLRTHYPFRLGVKGAYSPFGDQLGREAGQDWSVKGVLDLRFP